jgi:hypothetical protein
MALALAACTGKPIETPTDTQIKSLAASIMELGDHVDPVEATRAANIAFEYPVELAAQYGIEDAPLAHNRKVNRGDKERGLCWHWAEDLQAELNKQNFKTLEVHRAIANGLNPILISHSTALISAKGDSMYDAIVLDPWRNGGTLFWSKTLEDKRYNWYPRLEILTERRRRRLAYEGDL